MLSTHRDRLFRTIYDKAEDRVAKGTAALALGTYLLHKAGIARTLQRQKTPRRYLGVSEIYEKELRTCDPIAVRAEAIELLELVTERYADIPFSHGSEMMRASRETHARALMERETARKLTLGQEAGALLDDVIGLSVGKAAPEIEGMDFDGKPLKLSDYRGNVLLLAFWATWCGPCMAAVPHERELMQRLKGKPFALLGINCDADKETARKVMDREGIVWPNWYDGQPEDGPISKQYHITGIPTYYILDAKGVIRARGASGPRGEQLDQVLDNLLAELAE